MADGDPRMDVFGAVEPVVTHHVREQPVVDDSPSASGIPSSTRSRRTQSVDMSARPVRRKRERGERDRIRAELDAAAPGLALDPRIASDVLALERRFAAASKGKSPASRDRPHHRSHRPRHSLAVSPGRERSGSTEPQPLSTLPELSSPTHEIDSISQFSDPKSPTRLVGPALPSSGIPASSPSPPQPDPPPSDPPPVLKVDAPAYAVLLPSSDPEQTSASGAGPKRTSRAVKRASLTAMLGLTGRKKHKDGSGQEDDSTHLSVRPMNKRVDTQHTMRTFNTVHTAATAGSIESGDRASLGVGSSPGHGPNSSPGQARSASGTSSNPGFTTSPSLLEPPTIEPSAKTLARAAATRDQLSKRYGMLYASLDSETAGPPAPRLNPLEVLRWRAGILKEAKRSAEFTRNGMDGGSGEMWEREAERRARDTPPAPPAFQGTPIPAFLGNSLPEANSLSWLPYLEPLFTEERTKADGVGMGMGRDEYGGSEGMTAWYILASFVEGYVSSREQARSRPESFGSDIPKSVGSDGPKSVGSDAYKSFVSDGKSLLDPPPHATPKDVRAQAIVNNARRSGAGTSPGTGAISDDASASGSRFALIDRALRARSKSSVVIDGINRSRQGSLGVNSEPPSPSHLATTMPPVPSSQTSQSYNGKPSKIMGPVRSRSGSQIHHSRSQSQARSISAGNGPKHSSTNDFGVLNSKPTGQIHSQGDGKMSPASSRLNLATFILGGAVALGLGMRRGGARQPLAKDGVSGSENEGERLSSDCSPSDVDLYMKRQGGLSDGEGGRVKRRKKTWREREGGEVPLSDGDRERSREIRRPLRPEKVVLEPEEVKQEAEKECNEEDREKRCKEDYDRKKMTLVQGDDELAKANERLYSFTRLLSELNTVHREGSDVFGEMFTAVPLEVVQTLTPEFSDSDELLTPTTPKYSPLISFCKQLGDIETVPTAVDHIGRATLDADLPIAAFDALHALNGELMGISKRITDLRTFCDEAEEERKSVKSLYEHIAGNVGTYPECTNIEQLLGSLVTEDMPWLPSWLPLWVRHLLEIFSGQIQFLVENGLRIYGYVYSGISLISFVLNIFISLFLFVARFVRSYWFVFLGAALAGVGYLMVVPPEGVEADL